MDTLAFVALMLIGGTIGAFLPIPYCRLTPKYPPGRLSVGAIRVMRTASGTRACTCAIPLSASTGFG